MYKLLIVEDERSTREGLRDCVNWDSYNYNCNYLVDSHLSSSLAYYGFKVC